MINYNTVAHNFKRNIIKFSEKISKGLSRPEFKFTTQMIFGILSAQSCHLSKIARDLDENISLKKAIDRLSCNLKNFTKRDILSKNYLDKIKPILKETSILIIDGGDITKPCSKKLEGLCKVRDGSTGKIGDGYHTLGVTALTPDRKMPVPVYSKVYSNIEKDFISEDAEVLECLKDLSKNFSKNNIRTLDRGYDNNQYYEYFLNNDENFVTRSKKNRNVLYKGEKINILVLAKRFRGKYCLKFQNKDGLLIESKISIVQISLPCAPKKVLNLVICMGFGKTPMLLITNLKSDNKRLSVVITKVYLMRWRIEEFYKFKKQQFGFEDLRVRSLNSIRNLDLILNIAIGYLGLKSEKLNESAEVLQLIKLSKRIYGTPQFVFYAIDDGLFRLLKRCKLGIYDMLKKQTKSIQLSFFSQSLFGVD